MMASVLSVTLPTLILRGLILLGYLSFTSFSFAPLPQRYVLHVDQIQNTQQKQGDNNNVVQKFYRQNDRRKKHSSAKFGDTQYSLMGEANHDNHKKREILGTLTCRPRDHGWIFLKSLCVSRTQRRQGLALELLRLTLVDFAKRQQKGSTMVGVYCFADSSLSQLYLKAGFRNSQDNLPKIVLDHYSKLQARQSDIECFQWCPLKILLLQHAKEVTRKTGTAPLIFGTQHVNVQNQTWSGRADNDAVNKVIAEHNTLVLLWVGKDSNVSCYSPTNCTFLLLDGTWQEAQNMFRKIPALQQLPRLSLEASAASNYTLRKNFGWKDRFALDEKDTLLCTAEVAAELLHQNDNQAGANLVRDRLQDFQETF